MRKSLSESNIAASTHRPYMKLAKPASKTLESYKDSIRNEVSRIREVSKWNLIRNTEPISKEIL